MEIRFIWIAEYREIIENLNVNFHHSGRHSGDSDERDHHIPAQADHPFRAKLTRAFRGKLTTTNV